MEENGKSKFLHFRFLLKFKLKKSYLSLKILFLKNGVIFFFPVWGQFVFLTLKREAKLFRGSCILSSVSVAEWLPFGKQLLTRLAISSLCILTIGNISYFPFRF